MVTFHIDKEGQILQVLDTAALKAQYPDPPAEAVVTVELDFAAGDNPLIHALLHEDRKGARYTAGKFICDGMELVPDLTPALPTDGERALALYQTLQKGGTLSAEDLNWVLMRLLPSLF